MHNNCCSPYKHDHDNHIDRQDIERLWQKISATFATNRQVLDLIADLKRLEAGTSLQATHVAQAAAAMVIKTVKADIDRLKMFSVEVVPFVDKFGHPVVTDGVDYNTLYITPGCTAEDGDQDNQWDEWIAIPNNKTGNLDRPGTFTWERVGSKRVDLSWVKLEISEINKSIKALNDKLNKTNKFLARQILDKAIKPFKELQDYIHSQEYIQFVYKNLPRASMATDGLMTANTFALITMLSVWAANDHKIMGGGALGPDVVIHLLDKVGVPTEDLKKKYHHHGCCICED